MFTYPDVQLCQSAKVPFRTGQSQKKKPSSGKIANKFQRATIFQLNIKGLTASKIKVLHIITQQCETLIILLQETNWTNAEKLVFLSFQQTESSLSRKHGFATFVYNRLSYTLLYHSTPTSEIKWLWVDVDGYKMVNVYRPPPTRLQSLDLPVFLHRCLYAGDFKCRHVDWGYNDNSADCECLDG